MTETVFWTSTEIILFSLKQEEAGGYRRGEALDGRASCAPQHMLANYVEPEYKEDWGGREGEESHVRVKS